MNYEIPSAAAPYLPHMTTANLLQAGAIFLAAFIALIVWSLIWKGVALWYAARNNQKGWFVALMIINTAGILEILYLALGRKNKNTAVTTTTVTHTTVASTPEPVVTQPVATTPAPEMPSLAPTDEHV
jgi:Kef-type K+ transport system membrane component KefB